MCGGFAEFDRAMIRERVNAGLARAKAQGRVLGRPRVGQHVENKITEPRGNSMGVKRGARELRVGAGTVQRVKVAG